MDKPDKRVLATLFFSIFATVVGVGIVVPLLPGYAHDLGASGLHIGLIFGVFALSRAVFLPVFGRLSDKKGRRTLIVPGLFAYAVISLAFVYATDVASLVVIRFLHGVASAMLMPVFQAYVGDIAPPGREGRVMGLFSTCVLLGLSLGPLVGGLVNDNFGLHSAFLCMGMLTLVGCLLCHFFLPPASRERVAKTRNVPIPWRTLLGDGAIVGLALFRFAYVVCIGIIWGFLPLYADLDFSLSGSSIGLLITLGIMVSGVVNAPMGVVADRVDKRLMVASGGLLAGCAILSFQWADGYGDMLLSSVLFGLAGGVCMPALMAMATLRGRRTHAMGSVMALMTVAHSLGMLGGALLGGLLMDLFQLRLVFPAGAVVVTIGTALFLIGTPRAATDTVREFAIDAAAPTQIDSRP